jgi:hypothetical protein
VVGRVRNLNASYVKLMGEKGDELI